MTRRWFLLLLCYLLAPASLLCAEQTTRAPILLVAAPELEDPNFSQSVVLVLFPAHGGPVGVILNKPSELTVKEAFPEDKLLRARADKVFFGGPVRMDVLSYLVRSAKPPKEGYKVLDNVYLTQDASFLDALLAKYGKVERYFLGTTGWIASQLDAEIEAQQWFVLPADLDAILHMPPEHMWRNLLARARAVET
ncbi:MAG TPA: YqgE/AlgH family protein [Burkholderiales bacterium]|nr:YqgE/AlgH family protein [Burkholderiales bacterium]